MRSIKLQWPGNGFRIRDSLAEFDVRHILFMEDGQKTFDPQTAFSAHKRKRNIALSLVLINPRADEGGFRP